MQNGGECYLISTTLKTNFVDQLLAISNEVLLIFAIASFFLFHKERFLYFSF